MRSTMKTYLSPMLLAAGAALVLSGCFGWAHHGDWDDHPHGRGGGYHYRTGGNPPCVAPDSEAAQQGYPVCRRAP